MIKGAREKDVETVVVRTDIQLLKALEEKKKIRFDLKVFDVLSLRNRSKSVTVSKLLNIVAEDDHIPVLEFSFHEWTSKELKTLAGVLAKSKAITKIYVTPANNAIKTILEALESNTSVKTICLRPGLFPNLQTKRKFYEKLCQSLINGKINVETFEIEDVSAPGAMEHFDQLFDALKSANSIRSVLFRGCTELFEEKLNKFGELLLENKRITSLIMDSYYTPLKAAPTFIQIIKSNHITKLHLKDFMPEHPMPDLMAALNENTSITDLDIFHIKLDPMAFKDLVMRNRTILKLKCVIKLPPDVPIDTSVVDALEQNTSLTDLSISEALGIEKALLKNRTLRNLNIAQIHSLVDGHLFKRILIQNKTLTSLDLRFYRGSDSDMDLIIQGLANNTTLQSFGCKIENHNEITRRNFCKVIQDHLSITHLYTHDASDLSILRIWLPGFAEMIEQDVLQKNRSLRSWHPYDSFVEFQPYFKRNIKIQDYSIGVTKTIIRMICMKPQSFVLPIEIWSLIFNQVHFPGVNINFGDLFYQ